MIKYLTNLEIKKYFNFLLLLMLVLSIFASSNNTVFAMSSNQRKALKAGVLYANTNDSCSYGGVSGEGDARGLLSLYYPNFEDEQLVANNLTEYIKTKKPDSAWLKITEDIGSWLFEESKSRNINPLLIAAIGKQENGFGSSDLTHVQDYHNYFGMKGDTPIDIPGSAYRGFSSPTEGMLFFLDKVKQNTQSDDKGYYENVTNFYEYQSMHQSGTIIYPGEPFDPNDRTGPVFSNGSWVEDQSAPDGNTNDGYDPSMGVYISWTNNDHPNNEYDGQLFNPGIYFENSVNFINDLTGANLSKEPSRVSYGTLTCGGSSSSSGPFTAGPGGWDLPDEGPNPMVYYSQLNSGSDKSVEGYFGSYPYGQYKIQDCGCGPTTYAMVVSTLTSRKIKPDEMASWSVENNGQMPDCGSYWFWDRETAENTFKVNSAKITPTPENIKASLESGKLVIISVLRFPDPVNSEDVGHISLIRKYDNGEYFLADSFSEGWADVDDVSRRPYTEEELASIVDEAWEMSSQ